MIMVHQFPRGLLMGPGIIGPGVFPNHFVPRRLEEDGGLVGRKKADMRSKKRRYEVRDPQG